MAKKKYGHQTENTCHIDRLIRLMHLARRDTFVQSALSNIYDKEELWLLSIKNIVVKISQKSL